MSNETPCRECRYYGGESKHSDLFHCTKRNTWPPFDSYGCPSFAKRRDRWEACAAEFAEQFPWFNKKHADDFTGILRRHFPPVDRDRVHCAVVTTVDSLLSASRCEDITTAVLAALEGGRDEGE